MHGNPFLFQTNFGQIYNFFLVSQLSRIDGKLNPIYLVEYRDKENKLVTPEPLFLPIHQKEIRQSPRKKLQCENPY